jgi:hypothetical protein
LKTAGASDFISHDQIMANLNIKKDELEDVEVEIE